MAGKRRSEFHLSWTTITYRSVAATIVLFSAAVAIFSYLIFPDPTKAAIRTLSDFSANFVDKLAGVKPKARQPIGAQQAHFTNIDGTVRVKKASSNIWTAAEYATPLEKGDVIQTASEGMAKVVFTDNSSYTVKQDSLIVVEDNSVNASQQTEVSVQVTTGTVDLTTATFSQGSHSRVVVAGATASLESESSAQVQNDPRHDRHEILLRKGTGEVTRNGEVVRLGNYERVSFSNDSKRMAKDKTLGPPTLIGPANMAPIFAVGKNANVQFSWTPLERVSSYHLRVSRNPYFSSIVMDTKVPQSQHAAVLPEGAYYWTVQVVDGAGHESVESEKNRFTVIHKGADSIPLAMELLPFVQHGHVIEVRGKTEATARVMVNGQEVPMLSTDGSFQFLTAPLPTGQSVITITAQNAKGGVNTQQKTVIIQ